MAYEYSNNEYTEMVRVLAKSHDNAARACHEFVRLFPNLPRPSKELMLQTTQRLRDHGQFESSSSDMTSEEDEEEQDSGNDEGKQNNEEEDGEVNEEDGEDEEEEDKDQEPKPSPKEKLTESAVPVPAGKGIPLGHIRNVEVSLSCFKTQEQKILHQYLYGQLCNDLYVTENIKKFKGFQWTFNSTEYKAKLMETARMDPRQLRAMCEMLDLDKKGVPSELATRLMGFLQQPGAGSSGMSQASPVKTDNIVAAPVCGKRKARSLSPVRVVYRDEDYESDQNAKAADSQDGSEESDGSTKASVSRTSDTESEGDDVQVIGTEDREAEAKVLPDRQRTLPENKKNASVRTAKGEKASSEESSEEEGSNEDDSGEDSDTPADKKAKRPPTDEEIKKCLKKILEGANLEEITMKTVCKQVYSHYPDFDLEHKKNFIKATVKTLL